jgi:hypothetical protein
MSLFSHPSRFRALLVLLIGLQLFAQLAAVGHGVSHLAEQLGTLPGAASLVRSSGTAPENSGSSSNSTAPAGVHSCSLCLLAHDLAQALQTPPALTFAVPQGIDLALIPILPDRAIQPLPAQARGPPVFS